MCLIVQLPQGSEFDCFSQNLTWHIQATFFRSTILFFTSERLEACFYTTMMFLSLFCCHMSVWAGVGGAHMLDCHAAWIARLLMTNPRRRLKGWKLNTYAWQSVSIAHNQADNTVPQRNKQPTFSCSCHSLFLWGWYCLVFHEKDLTLHLIAYLRWNGSRLSICLKFRYLGFLFMMDDRMKRKREMD